MKFGAFALMLLALSPTASAQKPAPEKTIAGVWRFETTPITSGAITSSCKLAGDMQILKPAKDKPQTCKFTVVQTCTGDQPVEIKVEQSCAITRLGDAVGIKSSVDQIVSTKPPDMKDQARFHYQADDFDLTLNPAGSQMTGLFHSIGEAKVRFWRPSELVS
jgi:hypothetical protein